MLKRFLLVLFSVSLLFLACENPSSDSDDPDTPNYRLIKSNIFDSSGTSTGYIDYEYDSDGKLIKESLIFPSYFSDITEYTYNSAGKLIRADIYFDDDFVGHELYEYGSNDKISKIYHYNSEGNSGDIEIYEYDDEDKLVKVSVLEDGIPPANSYTTYEYDDDGLLIKSISYDYKYDGLELGYSYHLDATRVYEYDSDDYLEKKSVYDSSDELDYYYTYEYEEY